MDNEKSNCESSHGATLWALTSGQRARYAMAIAAMAVGTISLMFVPYALKYALDGLTDHNATVRGTLIPAALAIVGLHSIYGIFTYLRGRWAAEASEGIVRRLRHELYSHLEHLPCSYHDRADTGDLVQRCSSDVETVRVFLAAQVVEIARVVMLLTIAVPIMLSQDLRMTVLSLAVVPVIVLYAVRFFRKARKLFEQVDEAEGRLTTRLQENLTGIRVVRAFAGKEHEIERFMRCNDEFRDLEFRLLLALSNYWTLSNALVFLQFGLELIGGGYLAMRGDITVGTWILFSWLLRTIIWPIRQIGRTLVDSSKATVSIRRIQEILAVERESVEPVTDRPICGDIEVQGVSFAYHQGRPALNDLSLTIRSGETVALIGPPGAGKSTFVNLLVRLYDYREGSIQFGGMELNEINREAVRHAFGMVLQDPFLFSRTVRENVVLGRSSAADHEVEESAQAADVHENIMDFQEGYSTMVGERGVTLSGGQRQRIAIARALIKDPTYLVLDDSLSAVDTKTESHILRALAKRKGKKTTVLIAHRLSTARLADRIFVLDGGRLIQEGTHEELLQMDGPYRRLWTIQGALEDEIKHDLSGMALA